MCDGPSPDRTLVRLHETGIAGSTAYVAMEFATGESLDVALRHLAPMALDRALPMLESVAAAIDSAWAGGIGHGALHPRDIIVAPGTLDVRVTGFGIRPALESIGVVTAPRRPYSAPERSTAQVWDERADVYSLGAIAHELLTGRRPLGSGEPEESTLLHRVLARAMAASPDDRFASARALIDALDAVANSESAADAPAVAMTPIVVTEPVEEPVEEDVTDVPEEVADPAETVQIIEPVEPVEAELPLVHASPYVEPVAVEPEPAPPRVFGPPEPPSRPEVPRPLWAPFMTQSLPSLSAGDAAPRYRYPWGGMAAVLLAGVALGATGMHVYHRMGEPSIVAELPPVPPPADGAPARAETEVQVAPQTQTPPATAETPPPAVAPPPPPPRPQPETPVRAAAVTGRIVISSVPSGALVTINGRRAGETPLTLRDQPLGAYTVQVARRGYVPETRKVTLTNRAPAQTVSVPLKAGASQDAVPGSAKTGSIYADTRPRAARVVIDGRSYGTTPVLVPQLTPGTHTVRLEMDGYAPSSTSVTVRPGEQSRVSISLVRR